MALDQVGNFDKVTVSTTYDAVATSIVLSGGEGATLPDPTSGEYNMTWWDATTYADPADDPNVEIVRVTAIATDTLTVTRNQEGSGASTKNTGASTYKMLLGATAKMITDIDSNKVELSGVAGGQVIIGGTATTDDLSLQTTSGVGATGADMHFLVGNNGATEAVTILNDGNIGMGTVAPSAKLHIDQDAVNTAMLVQGGNGGAILARFQRDIGATGIVDISGSGADPQVIFDSEGAGALFSVGVDNGLQVFRIGEGSNIANITNGLTIQTDGKVGIGTETPGELLDVNGNISISAINSYLYMARADGFASEVLHVDSATDNLIIGDSALDEIHFDVDNKASAMVIDTNGQVGIGTAGPSALLELSSTAPQLLITDTDSTDYTDGIKVIGNNAAYYSALGTYSLEFIRATATTQDIIFGINSNTGTAFTDTGGDIHFKTNNAGSYAERLTILKSGNVGIGTTAPLSTLHIGNTDYTDITDGLSFGDGDTGLFESADDVLQVAIAGTDSVQFTAGDMRSTTNGAWLLLNEDASATNPVFSLDGDSNTGIGSNAADQLSLIAGGTEIIRCIEDTANKINIEAPFFVKEQAAANADVTAYGQLWVKNTTPNELWFTDDAGTDTQLGAGGGGGGATLTSYLSVPAYGEGNTGSKTWVGNTFAQAYLINIPGEITFTKVSFYVNTYTSASTFDIGIYTEDGQTKELEFTTASISSDGVKTTTVSSTTIGPGYYYIAIVPNGSSFNQAWDAWSSAPNLVRNNTPSGEAVFAGRITGITAGTLPATIDPTSDIVTGSFEGPMLRFDS